MSIHKSLVTAGKLRRHRNVLTRSERLEIMKKDGKWTDEDSVFGLPKIRNIMQKVKAKAKKEAAETTEAAAGAPAAAATPAAGAKPAAAAKAPAKTPAKGEEKKPAKK